LLDLPLLNGMQVQGDNSKNPVLGRVNSTKLTQQFHKASPFLLYKEPT